MAPVAAIPVEGKTCHLGHDEVIVSLSSDFLPLFPWNGSISVVTKSKDGDESESVIAAVQRKSVRLFGLILCIYKKEPGISEICILSLTPR